MRMRLDGARVWDGKEASTSPFPLRIWVDGGEIASLGRDPGGEDWRVVTLPPGSVAIPGLIDAHVHLDLDPGLMRPADQFAVSREDRDLRMVARARDMARAGITTARDLGAGEWRELLLRDAIARGELAGPRLLCAGQPVTVPDGHCHFWGGAAADADARAEVVKRQIDAGADWIKVMATGGVFTEGSAVDRAQFSTEEITALVRQAAAAGRRVAAHCHGAAGIRHAARGGVRTVEHCSFAGPGGFGSAFDPVAIDDLASQGTWVSPTVNEGWRRRIEKDGRETRFHRRMRFVFDALREASVPLVASTDAGIPGVRHDRLAFALPGFADFARLTPREVLCTATSDAARALDLDSLCGVLRAGLSADIVVLRGDPLEDLGVLEEPLFVLAGGRVMRDELGSTAVSVA